MLHRLKLCAALWPCLLVGCVAGSLPPSRTSTAPPGPVFSLARHTPPQNLRVMGFNLRTPFILDGPNHWAFRKDDVIDTIRRYQPDLLGTQECVAEQAWHLFNHLPNYDVVGAGRNDGRASGEMCAIFYRVDKFQKIDSGHFWLSETPHRPGSKGWDAMWRRMVTWVRLESRSDGRQFVFFNTHFDSNGDRARLESARLLRTRIAHIAAGQPAIVTGDFNAGEGSPPYRTLVTDVPHAVFALTDTYREAHPLPQSNEGTRHGFRGSTRGERIDWILITAGFDTLDADIHHARSGGRYPSDHFPVTATLRWNQMELVARGPAADAVRNTDG